MAKCIPCTMGVKDSTCQEHCKRGIRGWSTRESFERRPGRSGVQLSMPDEKNIDYFAVASLGYTGTPGECLTKFFKSGEGRKTEFRKIETNLGWEYEATLGGVGFCCTRIMPFNKPSYLLSSNLDEPPTWWWNVRPECEEGDHELILVISHIKDNEIINTTRWMVHVSVETPSPISAAATTTKKYGEPIFNMILKLLAGIGSAWILYEKMASRRKSKG
ncbi:MAG: hypothetical protein GKC10_07650 [Methanosarcinales archaeon]|nr:hypothetical protein [Methanosarcinales archaeon]